MNDWLAFLQATAPQLLEKILQQTYLSLGSVLIAALVSIPAGILIAKKKKIKQWVLAISSVLQTLPSLAILGFLLPILGIGVKTAIITLVFYAILPIIRNTVTGLQSIAPDLLEAADGLGLTRTQKLRFVELPLALPFIIAGVRTATAMCVGIATLAAFIGAGGLGDFIYEGLSLNNRKLILLGAVPAALLALALDYLLGKIEQKISAKKVLVKKASRIVWQGSFFLLLMGSYFLFVNLFYPINQVKIATKNFTEQLILGEMLAQLLQANTSLQIVKKFNLGGTFICHQALMNKEIDIYPEYTGTSYRVILKQTRIKNQQEMYHYLQSTYQKKFNAQWLGVFGFNNTNAVAVRQEYANKHAVKTISDLKAIAPSLPIGVPADFMERPDGYPGLNEIYKLKFADVKLMDAGLMYQAINLKKIDLIMAFSTDGRIPAYHLTLLQDDKHFFPEYQAGVIVRSDILLQHPEIKILLNKLIGKITNKTMQDLNYQVDVLKRTPQQVAHSFLQKQGLIQ